MTPSEPILPGRIETATRTSLLAGGLIVLAALAAYHNSFSGPFILDDYSAITDNPTIKHLGRTLSAPPSSTTGGRPVLNLTFALNYALGGINPWSYHAFNLLIHTLAGLTLFGLVRRTLASRLAPRGSQISDFKSKIVEGPATAQSEISNLKSEILEGTPPTVLALAIAVIWIVHPVQTEAVTYISQRAESLMGLFYLLTLYCFIRSQDSGDRIQEKQSGFRPLASDLWFLASVFSCLLGAMSKEVIVTAPLMVLLYDRTFVAGSFREAWRLRWRYYLGLACTWLLLARLMTGLNHRSVGFEQGVTGWSYALTSCRSVILYCKLALWPHPLVFDYGTNMIQHASEAVPYALVLAALLVGTAIALWRWPAIGFLGAWFFVILAPTSSVVPVALQPMAEHRLYLSLAAVVALVVLGLHRWIGRRSLVVFLALAVGLGWLSVQRNKDYRSELAMWSDTVAKYPANARALSNLGYALAKIPDQISEAIAADEAALRINPDYAEAHYNLGNILLNVPGRLPDAITHYEAALRLNPRSLETHNNFGNVLLDVPGRLPEAVAQFEAALQIDPDSATAHYNLGRALLKMPGRLPEAISQFEATLRINPDYPEAHFDLGNILLNVPGRLADAMVQYEAALQVDPNSAILHYNLGNALLKMPGRLPDAMAQFQAALSLNPDYAEAHMNMGIAFAQQGHLTEAIAQFGQTVRIAPKYAEAHYDLGNVLFQSGRFTDALSEYKIAIQLKPDYTEAYNNLGNTLAQLGRLSEAIGQYEQALRINPNDANARKDLEQVRKMMAQPAAGSGK